MKILLIDPWSTDQLPPPAIGYLQSILKIRGFDVIARGLNEAMNEEDNYDITGITFHSFSVKYAKYIREKFKGHLICGGHHPSALPEQLLNLGYNQVVIGEGEEAILDIVNGNTESIVQKSVKDINEIPFPDYSGLRFTGIPHGIPIISSRGCPFSCLFCDSTNFWGHKYKMRSADNVLAEIELRKSEGYLTWIFYDDNFTANKNRILEICSGLDGSYIWECVGRAENLDKELCHELFRAGCRMVHLGIESLSQEALDRMGKNTTIEKMLKGIENAESIGLRTMSLFLIGLPGDTIRDIELTRYHRQRSHITQYGTNICWVLPGTDIYKKAKAYGFNDDAYLSGVPFYTYEHSFEELTLWASQI